MKQTNLELRVRFGNEDLPEGENFDEVVQNIELDQLVVPVIKAAEAVTFLSGKITLDKIKEFELKTTNSCVQVLSACIKYDIGTFVTKVNITLTDMTGNSVVICDVSEKTQMPHWLNVSMGGIVMQYIHNVQDNTTIEPSIIEKDSGTITKVLSELGIESKLGDSTQMTLNDLPGYGFDNSTIMNSTMNSSTIEKAKESMEHGKDATLDTEVGIISVTEEKVDDELSALHTELLDALELISEDHSKIAEAIGYTQSAVDAVFGPSKDSLKSTYSRMLTVANNYLDLIREGRAPVQKTAVEAVIDKSKVMVKEEPVVDVKYKRKRGFADRVLSLMNLLGYESVNDVVINCPVNRTKLMFIYSGSLDSVSEQDIIDCLNVLTDHYEKVKKTLNKNEIRHNNCIAVVEEIREVLKPISHFTQREQGDITNVSSSYISAIKLGKYEKIGNEKTLRNILESVKKGVQAWRERTASLALKEAKEAALEKEKEELAALTVKPSSPSTESADHAKICGELRAKLVLLGDDEKELARILGVDIRTISAVMESIYLHIPTDLAPLMNELADVIIAERKEKDEKVSAVKSFEDLGKLNIEKKLPVHGTGVFIPQFNKDFYSKADEELKRICGNDIAGKSGKINKIYFQSNFSRLRIISKNAMEASKLTGIHYNTLAKAYNHGSKMVARDMTAIHLYLDSIQDQLDEIKALTI